MHSRARRRRGAPVGVVGRRDADRLGRRSIAIKATAAVRARRRAARGDVLKGRGSTSADPPERRCTVSCATTARVRRAAEGVDPSNLGLHPAEVHRRRRRCERARRALLPRPPREDPRREGRGCRDAVWMRLQAQDSPGDGAASATARAVAKTSSTGRSRGRARRPTTRRHPDRRRAWRLCGTLCSTT